MVILGLSEYNIITLFHIWYNISWCLGLSGQTLLILVKTRNEKPSEFKKLLLLLCWEPPQPAVGIWLHYIFSSSVLPWENLTHSDVNVNGKIFPLPLYHAYLEEGLWLERNKNMCRDLGIGTMWYILYCSSAWEGMWHTDSSKWEGGV